MRSPTMNHAFVLSLLTIVLIVLAAQIVSAENPEESSVHMVLGGIPLCGNPDIARDFLAPAEGSARKSFLRQWSSPSDGPSGTRVIKITDPVVPLKIGEKERYPSTLYIYLLEGKIHAVEARWAPRSGWGNFKKLITELETRVRASLGPPDSVTSSSPAAGWFSSGKSETESIWTEEHRIVRVFTRIGQWKNYVAIDVTCTATLTDTMGEEDIF